MATRDQARRAGSGFTLIELLVVVAIIALLVSILMPAMGKVREQGKKAKCGANLHSIGQAVASCWADYNDFGPSWDDGEADLTPTAVLYSWVDTLFDLGYTGNPDIQICPKDQRPDELTYLHAKAWGYNFVREFMHGENLRPGIRTSYAINAQMHFNFREERYKDPSRQVFAADGWWTWFGSLNAAWLMFPTVFKGNPPKWDWPNAAGVAVGWRHGSERSTMLLLCDGHVANLVPNRTGLSNIASLAYGTVDTIRYFTWLPGEHPSRWHYDTYDRPVLGMKNPYRDTTLDDRGILPRWAYIKMDQGRWSGGKWLAGPCTTMGRCENLFPFAYPDELCAVWRTQHRAWTKLPADPKDRN